ncbi:Mg2+/citrate symporter [Carnobacterium iners]|uniref:Mg2+/citrate symporter n=1 Tax=Carnobacterium iners TaxID=1073423 RepID=A0A1X7MPJ3_9LACT|nr:hypothetical protein [Carnobacterium iners]SEL09108.1 Mg2+/citrate symporter [Carnobacterium iners]SMH26544.1 Mg2+/citrate symporter [Carnobacterium iners]
MELFINLIPVVVVLILLFSNQHMLVAGFAGGILAIIIGGFGFDSITEQFIGGISNMLGITVPIIYAATAVMVSRAGSIKALVDLAKRVLRGRIAILAGIIVLIQGFATYAAGTAAGNTMVTAPLMAVAVGAIPEVIAAMAIISAVGFTTAPSSTETVLVATSSGRDVVDHAAAMLPYTIGFYLVAVALAIYGVHKRGSLVMKKEEEVEGEKEQSNISLLGRAFPFIALLAMVVVGSYLNGLIGTKVFTPATIVIITAILTVICTPLNLNEMSEALVDGSKFILTTLFAVGIFLAFINMIAELGTFEQIASIAKTVPEIILLPVTMILAFLIAIPSGAFAAGVLALILPTLSTLGLSSEAMGFVAIATGLGTQISPVQINVAALAEGFDMTVLDIVKSNTKFVVGMLLIIMIVAFIVI